MKLICAQPALPYFTWQVEVMIHSFLKQGINPNHIEIVCSYTGSIPATWIKMANHYNTVRFFFYPDTRGNHNYIPSIGAHILHKHWLAYPELETQTVLYHDSDIALFKPLALNDLIEGDVCYLSDTVSYIGADYIRSKGEHYLDLMCSVVGIDKEIVIANQANSGGAQYLLKSVPASYWNKVYVDSVNLYREVNKQIAIDKPEHPIQIWCASMWANLWNLWLLGKETKVVPQMGFAWATCNIEQLDKQQFYHNAGVTSHELGMFFKGAYINELPYGNLKPEYDPKRCSSQYVELIKETAQKTILN